MFVVMRKESTGKIQYWTDSQGRARSWSTREAAQQFVVANRLGNEALVVEVTDAGRLQ